MAHSCLDSAGISLGFSCNKALSRNLGFVVLASQMGGSCPGSNETANSRISEMHFLNIYCFRSAGFCISSPGHSSLILASGTHTVKLYRDETQKLRPQEFRVTIIEDHDKIEEAVPGTALYNL